MTDLSSYGVYFNSGQNNRSNKYITGDNVTNIRINASDQTYYQDGIIELFDCSTQNVGDNVDIYLNDSLEFSGYVARRQIHHKAGKKLYSYQLVGKTYDLWRYRTGKGQTYTGYTGYIASSLIHDYCTNIHGNSNISEGTNIENKIDLSDQTVGDALVTLTNYDSFKFYVDNENNLKYYNPDDDPINRIDITEDMIIDMSPIEEADEDLINDALVIGADGYFTTTEIPLPAGKAIANISSGTFKRNMLLAQRVKTKEDTLSAVRMFLGRSTEPYQPQNNVEFEVWDNTTRTIINDDFNGGMANWSVTSNTIFEDGNLQLSYIGVTYGQDTGTGTVQYYYHGQSFKPTVTAIVDSGYMSCYHSNDTNKTLWVEIRKTEDNGLPKSSGICSGSIDLTKNTYVNYSINLEPKVTLTSDALYYIVSYLNDKTVKTQKYANNYTDGSIALSVDGASWAYWASGIKDSAYKINLRNFSKSGFALSKPFGSPVRKIFDRYMKIDIDGVTSSQRVYISGSNSGSKNFEKLTDGLWYDFGVENKFSSQVKIWLSGNGTYTPKVGSIQVEIADSTSGPGGTVFTDNFLDYTYLSSATKNKVFADEDTGLLMMSGAKGVDDDTKWIRPTSIVDTKSYWVDEDKMIDSDGTSTVGTLTQTGVSVGGLALKTTFDTYRDISKIRIWAKNRGGASEYLRVTGFWASGNWNGVGFKKVWEGLHLIANDPGVLYSEEISFLNDCKYYDVKKFAISGNFSNTSADNQAIYDIKFLQENWTTYSGSIQSKDYNIGNPIVGLRLLPTNETYPNRITYSGSKNSGSTWYKLTKNVSTTLGAGGASGSHVKMMFNFKPSTLAITNTNPHISTQNLKNASPSIDSVVLEYNSTTSGDLPKSGTKLFNSDEIYLQHTDVAYPPSYSAWASYTYPSLRDSDGTILDTDNYYWLVMKAYSGATTALEHWKYYCDWDSTYADGLIAMSTGSATQGEGVIWKTHATNATLVPDGSLIMDIGWKGDEQIRATATNEQSINLYGRHQKIVNDSSIDSFALASSMANKMVEGMQEIPKKGSIVVDGIPGIKTTYRLSSQLTELGLGGDWEIVAYSQIVDGEGFRTQINYGKVPYDFIKDINTIKREMGI